MFILFIFTVYVQWHRATDARGDRGRPPNIFEHNFLMIRAVNQWFFPKGPKIASDKLAFTFLPTKRLYPSFLILPQNKPFSLVYTTECMINYIIYWCQYETAWKFIWPTSARPTYIARKIYVICMSAACFRCSTFKHKSRFRVIVRVNYSLVETHGIICADLPLILFISWL